ncbi:MAG: bifunctional diguanylate cyclase/phosphodiesterase [Clostridiales bacterium]|nr:bifunctional diguanylate cyclase/phosphodiesterase [Clostridiales bacterium]
MKSGYRGVIKRIIINNLFVSVIFMIIILSIRIIATKSGESIDNLDNILGIITIIAFAIIVIISICQIYFKLIFMEFDKEKNLAKTAIKTTGMYHIRIDLNGKILWCNNTFSDFTNKEQGKVINKEFYKIVNVPKNDFLEKLEDEKPFKMNIINNKNETAYVTWSIVKIKEKKNYYYELLGLDITDVLKKDLKIMEMDSLDEVTGLFNKKKLLLEGEVLIEKYKYDALSVYCLDIRKFQEFNNLRGREEGIEVVKIIAEVFKKIREKYSNVISAKIGIGEFAIIIPGFKEESSIIFREIMDKIDKELDEHCYLNDVRFSIGAAVYPENGGSVEEVFENADITLKVAKEKNTEETVFYDKDIIRIMLDKIIMENKIRSAIYSKEFQLYYQPKVDIKTGKLIGREALIRWNHPSEGIISPDYFIPLAEEVSLVKEIDEWVLLEACRQNAYWIKNDIGPKVSVSVNICAKEFYNFDIVRRVKNALRITGLEAKYLDIEVTESMTMLDIEEVTNRINKLKEIGVTISLDDFGTGYSSLSYLKSMPLDLIKLDKSFIDDICINKKSKELVQAIISLGNSIGIPILAEGIENTEQRDILLSLGCSYAQGYYFGKPMTPQNIESSYINS